MKKSKLASWSLIISLLVSSTSWADLQNSSTSDSTASSSYSSGNIQSEETKTASKSNAASTGSGKTDNPAESSTAVSQEQQS